MVAQKGFCIGIRLAATALRYVSRVSSAESVRSAESAESADSAELAALVGFCKVRADQVAS